MGAYEFITYAEGGTAKEAFSNAKRQALYEVGYQGYSGTIAEKDSFKMVPTVEGETIDETIERCLCDGTHFCQDKWGAAGCILVKEDAFVFFGWASS